MKKYLAIGINYETDGEKVDLPKNLMVECPDEDFVADAISDKTGWLVNSIGQIKEIKIIK